MMSKPCLKSLIFAIGFALTPGAECAVAPQTTAAHDSLVLPANSPQLAKLKIQAVQESLAATAEPLNGRIAFDEDHTARIYSPLSGRVVAIQARIGDHVKAGQVLMQMDAPDLGAAMADVSKSQADLILKKQTMERNRQLYAHGVLAEKEVEAAQADLAQAEAESHRAHARLNNFGPAVSGENYRVRSPVSGVIVDRQINPGMEVRPDAQAPLFIVSDPTRVWAMIDLPERDLARVHQGQAIQVSVDAYPGEVFMGRVLSIGGALDPATRRIPVHCLIESREGRLKPEMYARITPLEDGQRKVLRIPNSALVTEGLYSFVFVETVAGKLQKRRITLGEQTREYAVVVEGLRAGERIVTSGAILINAELAQGQ